jgi:hypothetical protein
MSRRRAVPSIYRSRATFGADYEAAGLELPLSLERSR